MSGPAKGSANERTLCREFSRWFSHKTSEDWFWRTSGSGARQTSRHRANKTLNKYDCGDMRHDCPEGQPLVERLNFEFRFRAKLEMLSVFNETDPNYSFVSFWAKACMEADQSGRIPILVTKVNRGSQIIWMPYGLWLCIPSSLTAMIGGGELRALIPSSTVRIDRNSRYTFANVQVVRGSLLSEFFKCVPPEDLLAAIREFDLTVCQKS